jgi:hypothetical protein
MLNKTIPQNDMMVENHECTVPGIPFLDRVLSLGRIMLVSPLNAFIEMDKE